MVLFFPLMSSFFSCVVVPLSDTLVSFIPETTFILHCETLHVPIFFSFCPLSLLSPTFNHRHSVLITHHTDNRHLNPPASNNLRNGSTKKLRLRSDLRGV